MTVKFRLIGKMEKRKDDLFGGLTSGMMKRRRADNRQKKIIEAVNTVSSEQRTMTEEVVRL